MGHAFKLYQKILDGHLCELVEIVKMQYGFVSGRGTVDAVVVLKRLTEQFRAKNKNLFFVFIDVEKAFDQVPREVICFALRQYGVSEYFVDGVMSLYKDYKTAVSVEGELSNSFSVKVGVYQGSALSPLLFITVMDVLTESLDEVMDKYGRSKNLVEGKCLRVNVGNKRYAVIIWEEKKCFKGGSLWCLVSRLFVILFNV